MSLVAHLLGDPNKKYLKKIQPLVDKINQLEKQLLSLSDQELQTKARELKQNIKSNGLEHDLPLAFALVRETSQRRSEEHTSELQSH